MPSALSSSSVRFSRFDWVWLPCLCRAFGNHLLLKMEHFVLITPLSLNSSYFINSDTTLSKSPRIHASVFKYARGTHEIRRTCQKSCHQLGLQLLSGYPGALIPRNNWSAGPAPQWLWAISAAIIFKIFGRQFQSLLTHAVATKVNVCLTPQPSPSDR
jgi:hypothetical protein